MIYFYLLLHKVESMLSYKYPQFVFSYYLLKLSYFYKVLFEKNVPKLRFPQTSDSTPCSHWDFQGMRLRKSTAAATDFMSQRPVIPLTATQIIMKVKSGCEGERGSGPNSLSKTPGRTSAILPLPRSRRSSISPDHRWK